jgi:hypothetical protein
VEEEKERTRRRRKRRRRKRRRKRPTRTCRLLQRPAGGAVGLVGVLLLGAVLGSNGGGARRGSRFFGAGNGLDRSEVPENRAIHQQTYHS